MVEEFGFIRPPKIVFGSGSIRKLPGLCAGLGTRILLITGGRSFSQQPVAEEVLNQLEMKGFSIFHSLIDHEPTPVDVDAVVDQYRSFPPDAVVGIGGGSTIDMAKAVSAMIVIGEPVTQYLEGIGTCKHNGSKLPCIAIPTTAGTGSEATANAVITLTGAGGFKRSLRHENFVPDLALVDSSLTHSCSPKITAWTGMDAFTQLIESFLSTRANRMTDSLAIEAIGMVGRNLVCAVEQGDHSEARSQMSYAAMVSGIVLANAGLGLVHGFAAAIGSRFQVPHGLVCATMMSVVNRANMERLSKEPDKSVYLEKYITLGKVLSARNDKKGSWYASFALDFLDRLTDSLPIGKLGEYGVEEGDLEILAANSDHKNNPVVFAPDSLMAMLRSRL